MTTSVKELHPMGSPERQTATCADLRPGDVVHLRATVDASQVPNDSKYVRVKYGDDWLSFPASAILAVEARLLRVGDAVRPLGVDRVATILAINSDRAWGRFVDCSAPLGEFLTEVSGLVRA